jgi:hypothetical protein
MANGEGSVEMGIRACLLEFCGVLQGVIKSFCSEPGERDMTNLFGRKDKKFVHLNFFEDFSANTTITGNMPTIRGSK